MENFFSLKLRDFVNFLHGISVSVSAEISANFDLGRALVKTQSNV